MGLRDVFSRRRHRDEAGPQRAPESGGEPGSVSSQLDVEGRGPVRLQDRTAPGGQASPDTNQGKAEPMPASPGEADPSAAQPAPELEDMNVGAADPQTPSHVLARDRDVAAGGHGVPAGHGVPTGPVHPGVAPADDRPVVAPETSTGGGAGSGPERPVPLTLGTAQRQPGSLGVSPEEQETDVAVGAARMVPGHPPASVPPPDQPGDSQGVAVPHADPAPGTSQEQGIVHGVRSPVAEDPAP